MGAAAIIPIVAMMGSGLDMSRAYLVQTRMQQACDAATLAARKKLSGGETAGGNVPVAVRNVANDFFDANFQNGDYGTQDLTFNLRAGTATRMDGTATVTLPTVLMQIVGYDNFNLTVNCSAELNLPNIDVMLVLDLSSSMFTNDRIGSLKQAVLQFYDAVHAVKPANSRVRIGVVTYSSTVNVGRILHDADPAWLASTWTYQTREALAPEEFANAQELLPSNQSQLGQSGASTRWTDSSSERNRCTGMGPAGGRVFNVGNDEWVIVGAQFLPNHFSSGNPRGACRATVRKTRFPYRYLSKELDTSNYKRFNSVSVNVGTRGAAVSSTWNGCIEERGTVAQAMWATIPADAYDLDINTVPNSNPATQWKPMWPAASFPRTARNTQTPDTWTTTTNNASYSSFAACPTASRKLREYPLNGGSRNTDFQNYINSLTPAGGTMHDIGMVWGARLLVPNGLFGSENSTAPNGDPIRRYIIFMSDGEMGADPQNYIGYGHPNMDGRFLGIKGTNQRWSEAELATVHNRRLRALCERIKDQSITIFTIMFDLSQNEFTRGCATGTERAFEASGRDELIDTFREIAGTIAELRLVN